MSTTDDLKQSKPKAASKKASQKTPVEILGKGITSEAQALEYMKAVDIKPQDVFRGEKVVALFCTSDGQFFYEQGSAANHIRKYKHVDTKYFTVKL